jgi:hypothetical protein
MDKSRERIDDLTDDEIDSWGIRDDLFVGCYDVPTTVGCCFECHDAEGQGRANLTVVESLGKKKVKTWLCCAQRKHWHDLDMPEKLEVLSKAEFNPDRPRAIELDCDLIRKICLTIEAAIEADDDYATKLEHLNIAGYGKGEVSDQIWLLSDSGFVEAKQVGPKMRFQVQRLTAQGWQFVNAVRGDETWKAVKATLGDSLIAAEAKRENEVRHLTERALAILQGARVDDVQVLFQLSRNCANQTEERR